MEDGEQLNMKAKYETVTTERGDRVHLRKGVLGYGIVHPLKNEDGSWNIPNLLFGGKANLVKLIILILFVLLIYIGLKDLTTQCEHVINNACTYCTELIWSPSLA